MMTSSLSGILVPGGFGQRGTEGKISAVKHARERKIPYLGLFLYVVCICYILAYYDDDDDDVITDFQE